MRYLIGFLVTIGLIVLIVVLLLSGRGGKSSTTPPLNLADYNTGSSAVQLIIDGPIVSDQEHHEAKIVVSQNTVVFTGYTGYQGTVLHSQDFSNNPSSYAVFLHALQHAGFTLYNTGVPSDERGYCASGERYIFSLSNAGSDVRRTWTTSCGSAIKGSFAGPLDTIRNLFEGQVPNYDTLSNDLDVF